MIIAGVDEAGRGAIAGPVVAGAVILPKQYPRDLIKDSKQLSVKKRQEAYAWISEHAEWAVGCVSAKDIDVLGIKKANHNAMQMAVSQLKQQPGKLLVDGRDGFIFDIVSEDVVRGDSKHACIAAASIMAKVTRDAMMMNYDKMFTGYGFAGHKGYGSADHLKALKSLGHTDIHRVSFDPLKTLLTQYSLFDI